MVSASRATTLARALVAHLRVVLATPGLDLAEPLAALSGGFDTEIFALRLRGAPSAFGRPLVLRVLRSHHEPAMVMRERAVQNAVADQGYPAPRVLLASADATSIGAPFLIMEHVPGVPLVRAGWRGMNRVLVDLQLRLHLLDATPVRRALGDRATFEGYLDSLARRIDKGGLTGLAPLVAWLRERRPPAGTLAICHGDFHPQNVLVDHGAVTGVLDWPNTLVADPAFDVASTLNILKFVPAELVSIPRPFRWLLRIGQPVLASRYLSRYRRRRPIDEARLAYYQVASGLRQLVRAAESRRRADGVPAGGLDASPFAARLLADASRVTGLSLSLPAMA
jgi:aminoglycoside phosphotransferase (APT) family kinase protein